jgi:hypothetical protein
MLDFLDFLILAMGRNFAVHLEDTLSSIICFPQMVRQFGKQNTHSNEHFASPYPLGIREKNENK